MKKRATTIEVAKIELDKENPRIKAALENPSIGVSCNLVAYQPHPVNYFSTYGYR